MAAPLLFLGVLEQEHDLMDLFEKRFMWLNSQSFFMTVEKYCDSMCCLCFDLL